MFDVILVKESWFFFGFVVYFKYWVIVVWMYVGGCLFILILLFLVLCVFVVRVVGLVV